MSVAKSRKAQGTQRGRTNPAFADRVVVHHLEWLCALRLFVALAAGDDVVPKLQLVLTALQSPGVNAYMYLSFCCQLHLQEDSTT